jgi:c-di-GMP-related signal transduction protein
MYEKFIVRQPIFHDRLKLFAYELLFRAGSENVFKPRKQASSSMISLPHRQTCRREAAA